MHIRNSTTSGAKRTAVPPYMLSLELDLSRTPPLPSLAGTGNKTLITESYDRMYHHLLLHLRDEGKSKGVVLTGQPGVGASPRPDFTPHDNSLAHLFYMEGYLSLVHACTVGFSPPGHALVWQPRNPPLLPWSSGFSTDSFRLRQSSSAHTG